MSSLPARKFEHIADEVKIANDTLEVCLADGRLISVPLEWFPKLRDANEQQRNNWRLIGRGIGINWPDIDEDILVENLF